MHVFWTLLHVYCYHIFKLKTSELELYGLYYFNLETDVDIIVSGFLRTA